MTPTLCVLWCAALLTPADELSDLRNRVDFLERQVKQLTARDGEVAAAIKALQARPQPPRDTPTAAARAALRNWTFADGSTLDAVLVDFRDGQAVLVEENGEEHRVSVGELSTADRTLVQALVKQRTDNARQRQLGAVIDCPNKHCKRGILYGPVGASGVLQSAGRTDVISISGLGPRGTCPTCDGRGVVPNPHKR